jgi:hypothetical protein
MAIDLSSASLNAILKENYIDIFVDVEFRNSPIMGLIPRKKDTGELFVQAISYGGSQNHGANYSKVHAKTTKPKVVKFSTTTVDYFGKVIMEHKMMKASADQKGAFIESLVLTTKQALAEYSKELSLQMYRKSSGFKGLVASVSTAGSVDTITLSARGDVALFGVGMDLIASANADGSSPRDSGTSKQVTKVDPANGVITLSGNIASLAAGDYLFIDGNEGEAINGILDWIPESSDRSSLSTPFLGVDRSVSTSMLAGLAIDGSSMTMEEALQSASSECTWHDVSPRKCMMHPFDFLKLKKEVSSKETIEKSKINGVGAAAVIGYDMFTIGGLNAEIIQDPHVPQGKAFFIDPESWELRHYGNDVVNEWDDDSLRFIRDDSNNLTGTYYSYHNLMCNAPKKNLVLTLPS